MRRRRILHEIDIITDCVHNIYKDYSKKTVLEYYVDIWNNVIIGLPLLMPLLSHKLTLNINDNSNKLSVPVQLDITIVSSPIYCLDNHPSTTLARRLHRGQSSRSGTEQRHREAPKAFIDRKLTLICMFMFGHNCSLLFNQTTEYLNWC